MLLQGATYGLITRMKNQSPKMQAKCARLFTKWNAERVNMAREEYSIAYDHAFQMAGKCSPAQQLAKKSQRQDKILATVAKLRPALKNGLARVSNLKSGHERMHKQELKSKEMKRKKAAAEKRAKMFGKEGEAKKAERNEKEKNHKSYHRHWRSENDVAEKKNKALVVYNHNEQLMVNDVKLRAKAMEVAIKKGGHKFESLPENLRLHVARKEARKKLDKLDRQLSSIQHKRIRAQMELSPK